MRSKTKPGCSLCECDSGKNKRKRWIVPEFDITDDDDDDVSKPITEMKTNGPPDKKSTLGASQTPKVQK